MKLIFTVAFFSIFMYAVAYANEISVTIEGERVDFADQHPAIVDGRTLVPVRGVFEHLGFAVEWNGDARTAILSYTDFEVIITLDSNVFTTNGISHNLEVPAQIINGRTMLPIRAVLESVGYNVSWNGTTRMVTIISKPSTSAPITVQSEIRRHLGVNYTIRQQGSVTEHSARGRDTLLQYVDVHEALDLSNFEGHWQGSMALLTNTGDVVLQSWSCGSAILHIHISPKDYPFANIYSTIYISLNQGQSVDLSEMIRLQYEQKETEYERLFEMTNRHTSANFYWYSTAADAVMLPALAGELERHFFTLIGLFGFQPNFKIRVFVFDYYNFNVYHPNGIGVYIGGYADRYSFTLIKPQGSMDVSDNLISTMVHELVHVFQGQMPSHKSPSTLGWVTEGTATYLASVIALDFKDVTSNLSHDIRNNRMLTLNDLENDEFVRINGGVIYCWGSSIIQFIYESWSWEHVIEKNRRHGDYQGIFGISRMEFERRWHDWLRGYY
jgi:hypothetical protein